MAIGSSQNSASIEIGIDKLGMAGVCSEISVRNSHWVLVTDRQVVGREFSLEKILSLAKCLISSYGIGDRGEYTIAWRKSTFFTITVQMFVFIHLEMDAVCCYRCLSQIAHIITVSDAMSLTCCHIYADIRLLQF